MNSPFPGMDPYLEDPALWSDFHFRFINCWCEQIADVLPDNYEARIGERVYVVEPMQIGRKKLGPDVTVTRPRKRTTSRQETTGTATLEPVTIANLFLEEVSEAFIQLIRRPERKVVTVLDMLSPTNKTGEGREIYLRKRNSLLVQKVNIVELDLLLGGRPMPLAKPLPQGDYHYLVTRRERRADCEVYGWNLQEPLPTLPVPLLVPDSDVFCDLKKVFTTTYERGRYRKEINYGAAPPVKIGARQMKWVRQQGRATKE